MTLGAQWCEPLLGGGALVAKHVRRAGDGVPFGSKAFAHQAGFEKGSTTGDGHFRASGPTPGTGLLRMPGSLDAVKHKWSTQAINLRYY